MASGSRGNKRKSAPARPKQPPAKTTQPAKQHPAKQQPAAKAPRAQPAGAKQPQARATTKATRTAAQRRSTRAAAVAKAKTRRPAGQLRPLLTPTDDFRPDGGWSRIDTAWAAGIAVVCLVVYLITAARGLMTGDGPELVTATRTFGVAHAPGYPLLTLTARIFSWIMPIGGFVFRLSLYCAAASTAASVLIYATVRRLSEWRAAAVTASLAAAFTPAVWLWSVQFEVFALANLLAVLLVFLLVRWQQQPERAGYLIGAAFVFGLALCDQQTIVFLAPAIIWLLVHNRRYLQRAPKAVAWAVGAFVVGLLPYLYVPIAASGNPATSFDDVRSVGAFLRLVTRSDYGNGLSLAANGSSTGNPLTRLGYFGLGIGFTVGLLALAGLVYGWQARRWYFWFGVLAFAFTGMLFQLIAGYDPTDDTALFVLQRFYLLPVALLAPLAGFGVVQVAQWARQVIRFPLSRLVVGVCVVSLVVTAAVAAVSYSTNDLHDDHLSQNLAVDMLDGQPRNAVLLVLGDEAVAPLLYVHDVEHVRPDVTLVETGYFGTSWYHDELARTNIHVPAELTTLSLIQANPGRPFTDFGALPDNTTSGKYYVYRDGLTFDLVAQAVNKSVADLTGDNQAKLAMYHVPRWQDVKPVSFEQVILDDYATVPFEVGDSLVKVNQKQQALTWFRRALAISPHNAKIRAAYVADGG